MTTLRVMAAIGVATIVAIAAAPVRMTARTPAEPDTWQDVQNAGKLAHAELNRLTTQLEQKSKGVDAKASKDAATQLAGARKVESLIARLDRDPDFCKQVFAASQKGNPQAVATVLSSELGVPIKAQDLRDFYFVGGFSFGGTHYQFCVSSRQECTSGDGGPGHSVIVEADR